MTLRDRVWSTVLIELRRRGKFRISELPFDEGERHTTRRVLKEMEEKGWLGRESPRAATWRIGELGELYLNVPEDHIERAWSRNPESKHD
jgi:hypothetical protein